VRYRPTTARNRAHHLQWKTARAECAAGIREIGLREVLIMRVRVIDVIRLKICVETFIEHVH
jgi:hypothetical protein